MMDIELLLEQKEAQYKRRYKKEIVHGDIIRGKYDNNDSINN